MNRFLKVLYEEHAVIMTALDLTNDIGKLRSSEPEEYKSLATRLVSFLRGYADEFHHHKEELILFPEMARRSELMDSGIIMEMLDNHGDFREMIGEISQALATGNYDKSQKVLEKYVNGLMDHIAVENEEVFQAAESIFSEEELERIGYRFEDCDRELGNERKEEFLGLAEEIRKELVMA